MVKYRQKGTAMKALLLSLMLVLGLSTPALAQVDFQGRDVYYNGTILNPGSPAEGLMMNARMIQAAVEEYGGARAKWAYPNEPFSAHRNVTEFIDHLDDYAAKGLNMVTVGMQGGHPRFKCGDSSGSAKRNFSMFTSDGTLRADAKARLANLIEAAEAQGIIVTVQYFYQNQDNRLSGNAAVLKATTQATEFLRDLPNGNILVEVANEVSTSNYKHTALQPQSIADRIDQVHNIWPGALVTVSQHENNRLGRDAIQRAQDWVSIHANGETASSIVTIINRAKNDPDLAGQPIAITEDPWELAAMNNAVNAGAGWGFYRQGCEIAGNYTGSARYKHGFQSLPVNWGITDDPGKVAFFNRLEELT
jgi:hypothetical protein